MTILVLSGRSPQCAAGDDQEALTWRQEADASYAIARFAYADLPAKRLERDSGRS